MCVWEGIPREEYNLFDIERIRKSHGYQRFEKIWWRNPQVDGPEMYQLRELLTDNDICSMTNVSMSNNDEIELYFEHPPIPVPLQTILEENEAAHVDDENPDDGNADDENEGVDVTFVGKKKGKAKVVEKGRGKAKVVEKGKGKAKVSEKGKGKELG